MKIAVLTEIINRKSGARAPLEIAKALKKQGNELTIFAFKYDLEEDAVSELKRLGINVSIIDSCKIIAPFILFRRLKGNFDILSYHAKLPAFIAAYLSGLPLIRTYHGIQFDPMIDKFFPRRPTFWIKILNWLANIYIKISESILLYNSDRILAISKYTQKEMKKIFNYDSEYIYYGAVPSNFKYKRRQSKKEVVITSVSRIIPYKGFHKIIKIFNQIYKESPSTRLEIIGSAPDEKYLDYLKKIAGPKIRFFLNISDEKLVKHYQKADIYATFDRYMFFGMPLLEAGFFGLPTVAIDKCAAPEIIKHSQTGFLAKSEAEFKNYLKELIRNPLLRSKMGRNARQEAKKFSWEAFGTQYTKWFKEVIKNSKEKVVSRKKLELIFLLGGILTFGLFLRIAFIQSHTFWFDEAFSYFMASLPFDALLKAAASDSQPPLYYLLLKVWGGISDKIWFLRFLSLIFGVFSIPLFYKIGRKLTNAPIAILATAILTFSPLHLYFSTETRMYSLLVFEVLFLFWFFLKFIETKKNLYLLLLTAVGILALYTHYYASLALLAVNLAFFTQMKKGESLLLSWLSSQMAIILAFLPWFSFSLRFSHAGCWCFPPATGILAAFTSFAVGGMGVVTLKDIVFSGPRLPLTIFTILSTLMFIAFLLGLRTLWKDAVKNHLLLIFFFTPLLMVIIISFFYPLFSPRALIIVSPFYYLFAAVGILSFKNQLAQKLLIKVLFILIFITLAFQLFDPFFSGPPLKEAADFIEEKYQNRETILHLSPMTFYSFLYFHRFSHPEFLTIPTKSPTIFDIGNWRKSLPEATSQYSKIWLVDIPSWSNPQDGKKIRDLLSKRFFLDFEKSYNSIEIYHYEEKSLQ